jgi:hypothetical protein
MSEQTQELKTYDASSVNEIPVISGTSGCAYPKSDAPVAAVLNPPADFTTPSPWGDEGETLSGHVGLCIHIAQDSEGDHYPNDELDPDGTPTYYEAGEVLDPSTDARAAYLTKFWADQGHDVVVNEVTKTKGVNIVGIAAEEGRLQTADTADDGSENDGVTPFKAGGLIFQSPSNTDRVWAVTPGVFNKKYQGLKQNETIIFSEEAVSEEASAVA